MKPFYLSVYLTTLFFDRISTVYTENFHERNLKILLKFNTIIDIEDREA